MIVDFSNFFDDINSVYKDFSFDNSRIQNFYGGAGSGKSYYIVQDELYKQLAVKGNNLLVVRAVGKENRRSTFALFQQVINSWGMRDSKYFEIFTGDMVITCKPTGNMITFTGLDDVNKLKSITYSSGILTRIWVEEASEVKKAEDFRQLNLRLRGIAPVPFQIRLSYNPISAFHWIKKMFFDKNVDNCKILHTTYKDNRFLDPNYAEVLEKLKEEDENYYNIYTLGVWGQAGDLVFKKWESGVSPYKFNDYDQIIIGMDFGFNNPSAIEFIGIRDDVLYSIDEFYQSGLTNLQLIEAVKDKIDKSWVIIADSAEPARIKEWQQHGYQIRGCVKNDSSVRRSIDVLRSKKWVVNPEKCPNLINELRAYSYKKDVSGELSDMPIKFNDHGIDACRYASELLFKTDFVWGTKVEVI